MLLLWGGQVELWLVMELAVLPALRSHQWEELLLRGFIREVSGGICR
jgi:hypothetical protein